MYYNADNTARMDGCLMMKAALENASKDSSHPIKVYVNSMEWTAFNNANDNGNMPLFYLGWMPDYADADDYVQPFLLSTGIYGGPLGLHNTTLDTLIIGASQELNTTLRAQMYAEISKSAYDNAIYIYTDIGTNFHAERTWVHGYYFNPMYSGQIYYHFSKS
jgi:peptide/nickel transport system substrate-binding protein